MVICAQCGEHNPEGARFCGSCNAFLEWEGAPAEEQQPVAAGSQAATVAQPSEPAPAPTRHRTETTPEQRRAPAPGDLICGQCGEGNAATRLFCRRCGASLADSVAVRLPWWRRLLRFLRGRKERRYSAGARPGRGGMRRRGRVGSTVREALRWARNILAIAVLLAAIVYAVVPPFRSTVNTNAVNLKNRVVGMFVTHYTPVNPDKVTANVADPSHPADLAEDNIIGTYWAAPENGPEPTLVLTFATPVDLARAIVRSGIGADFQAADRPQTLHLVFSTGKTDDIHLNDTPDPQTVDIANSAGATSVEVHVTSVYHSLHGSELAIDEIELFQKS